VTHICDAVGPAEATFLAAEGFELSVRPWRAATVPFGAPARDRVEARAQAEATCLALFQV
jgi:hypothetical protein